MENFNRKRKNSIFVDMEQNFYNFSDDAARNNGGIGQNYAYPPAATYAAYPPYTATNYGYEPPSYFTNVSPEAGGKY